MHIIYVPKITTLKARKVITAAFLNASLGTEYLNAFPEQFVADDLIP